MFSPRHGHQVVQPYPVECGYGLNVVLVLFWMACCCLGLLCMERIIVGAMIAVHGGGIEPIGRLGPVS